MSWGDAEVRWQDAEVRWQDAGADEWGLMNAVR